jgi:hypothetical protein
MIASKNYSQDSKLGFGVWATYRSKDSCPTDCAMYKACYAKKGPCGIQFAKATNGGQENDAETIKAYVSSRPKGDKIRHHVAGDLLMNDTPDTDYIQAMVESHKARPDLKAWTYTHAWKRIENVFKGIASLTVNASCDKASDIKEAKAKGFDTCMVVSKNTPAVSVIEGEKVIVCPNQVQAQRGVKLTCSQCMLCFKKDRGYTVGFRQH